MDLIGLSTKRRKAFAERLVNSFKKLLFSPLINKDMIAEIQFNIRGLLRKDPRDRHGPTADALRKGEINEAKITAIIDRLETVIESSGIQIDRNFDQNLRIKEIVERDLQTALLSNIQSHYFNMNAAERDVRTIIGVYGRRGSALPQDLYSSKSIFITSNEMLATISNRFFRNNLNYRDSTFPVVVTRSVSAALSDAIIGVESSGNMSLADMLISAADATQYNVEVFEKIEKQLREIAPDEADDLVNLLSRTDFSELAMDVVRGNAQNVNAESVHDIATNIKNKLEAEAEGRVKDKIDKINRTMRSTSAQHLRQISEERLRNEKAVSQIKTVHKKAETSILLLHSTSIKNVRNFQLWLFRIALIIPTAVFVITYLATYYGDFLSREPILRFWTALIVAAISGGPLIGFRPLREILLEKFKRRESRILNVKIDAFGYDLHGVLEKSHEQLRSELDHQLKERLSLIEFVDRGPPGKVSLI